jgi:ribonucleoside-diphosphate reductase alpha chain
VAFGFLANDEAAQQFSLATEAGGHGGGQGDRVSAEGESTESIDLHAASDFLTAEEKAVYKTSFEIDQRWLLEFAADRTPYIDQAQSLNLFIPADVDKWDLMMLHFQAWERGIKSLYYLRSKSVQRAGFVGGVEADNTSELARIELTAAGDPTDYEECLSCQ